MKKVNDIRTGRHCVFLLHAHLVFVTKYRYGVFTKIILDGLKEIFASVCRDFEAELGQQSERRIRQADSQERLSPDSEKTLGWPALVARLFCRELWRSAYLCSAAVYRSSTNAQLKAKIPVMVRLISPP